MILRFGKRHREVDGLQIEPGRERLLALAFSAAPCCARRDHVVEEVADVDHAARIVERVVVDGQARMAGALEHLEQFAERDVLLDRDDVGARHHDVVDPGPRRPRMFLSIARSWARSRLRRAHRFQDVCRSARVEFGFQLNRARTTRASQPSLARALAAAPAREDSCVGTPVDRRDLNQCDLARRYRAWRSVSSNVVRQRLARKRLVRQIGVGDAEPRQNDAFELSIASASASDS